MRSIAFRGLAVAFVIFCGGCADTDPPRGRPVSVSFDRGFADVRLELVTGGKVIVPEAQCVGRRVTNGECYGDGTSASTLCSATSPTSQSCRINAQYGDYEISVAGDVQPLQVTLFDGLNRSAPLLFDSAAPGTPPSTVQLTRSPFRIAFSMPFERTSSAGEVHAMEALVSFSTHAALRTTVTPSRSLLLNGVPITGDENTIQTQLVDSQHRPVRQAFRVARYDGETCAVRVTPTSLDSETIAGADFVEVRLPTLLTENREGIQQPIRELTLTINCESTDGGVPDAGLDDAGIPDAGGIDAGMPDAGFIDAGIPDAGSMNGVPAHVACAPAVYAAAISGSDRVNRHASDGTLERTFSPFGSSSAVRITPMKRTNGSALAVLENGRVTIFDNAGNIEQSFLPISGNAGSIAACDFDFDGNDDVLVGTKDGVIAKFSVTLFDGTELQPVAPIPNHTGALSVACGDVEGNGTPLVIVGPGYTTDNSVRVFTMQGGLLTTFQPYGSGFWDGPEVAVGRLTAGQPERIITAQRTFSATEVRVFSGGGAQLGSRAVFGTAYEQGSSVAAADLDADGVDEVIVGQRAMSAEVRILTGVTLNQRSAWLSAGFNGGVSLSATPRSSWQCPTMTTDAGVDAGVPDAGTQPRDAGAGCTADEGHQIFKLPQPYQDLYTRVEQRNGYAWFTEGGGGGYASIWKVPLDGGAAVPLANAVQEPTGLVVTDTDVFYSDKGNFGQLNGRVSRVPLDGGGQVETNMLDFPINVALASTDAGTSLVWITSGNTRLNRSDLDVTWLESTTTLSSPTVMTTDETHVYYANFNRVVQRFPLDFTSTTQAKTLADSQTVQLDPVFAMQVVGDDLFILHSAGLPNARTRVTRLARDGSSGPVLVATVNGVQSRAMHIANGFIYVAEGGVAPGCDTYRIWRVPVQSVQASSVQTVANSSRPISDFSVGSQWLVLLRDAVWAVPSP